jgi:hypothetical protein
MYFLQGLCLSSQSRQVILVEERWPGPDKTHVSFEYAVKLGMFTKVELAQDFPDLGHIPVRVVQQMSGNGRYPLPHRPELRHFENSVVFSDAVRPEQRPPFGCQFDHQGNKNHVLDIVLGYCIVSYR